MKFEERLSEIINEVEVPDELLPQNIAVMLRERSTQTNRNAGYKDKNTARRRIIVFRTSAAAVAACAALAVGIAALPNEDPANQLEAPIEYEATSPDSYDALYNIYTGITLNGSAVPDSEITLDEAARSGDNADEGFSSGDFTDTRSGKASEADIMKIDGNYMYCLKGRNLYVISLETMEVVSQTESSITPPMEMYINGGRLILISKETVYTHGSGNEKADGVALSTGDLAPVSDVPAKDTDTHNPMYDDSDSPDRAAPTDKTGTASETENGESAIPAVCRTNTVVDVYDVSEPERPVHTTAYKQNGSYVSSKFSDGTLYLVTDHSDYRVKPLDTCDDLDGFVPAYYLNGEKSYIDAEDIIIPSNAASTDYTVVSAIRAEDASVVSVKAVLGSGRNVYCSANSLYIAGAGTKDGINYTVISAFDLTQGGISYRASGSVEGVFIGQQSMNEYGGFFRIAAEITDNEGNTSVSVYVLDRSLTVVNSAGELVPGSRISAVRFEKQYARLIDAESGESALVLDLSENPPVMAGSLMGNEAYLCGYSEDMLLGVGKSREGGLTLTMYSSETGLALNGTVFGNEKDGEAEIIGEVSSKALTDRRAVLIDSENGIIGVPAYSHNEFGTKNSYYVYSYNAADGFVLKGVIEYVDVDDSTIFSRGAVKDGTLYVISSGRVISARLDDLKVIGVYEY